MTKHKEGDECNTAQELARQSSDLSWLRHRGLAGELDRRLLAGATSAELAEVRGSWKGHIRHLREEHNLVVMEDPVGYWKLMEPTATPVDAGQHELSSEELTDEDELCDADDYAGMAVAPPAAATDNLNRFDVTAKALAALASAGLLKSELLKHSVGMMIRQASESNHWHNCAHFRSREAAQLIASNSASIRSAAEYQAFCRKNLRHEHVVPNSVIYKMLTTMTAPTEAEIVKLLQKFCIRATITRREDSELSIRGLASSMPKGFDFKNLEKMDPMARYVEAGLLQSLVQRTPGVLWFQHDDRAKQVS